MTNVFETSFLKSKLFKVYIKLFIKKIVTQSDYTKLLWVTSSFLIGWDEKCLQYQHTTRKFYSISELFSYVNIKKCIISNTSFFCHPKICAQLSVNIVLFTIVYKYPQKNVWVCMYIIIYANTAKKVPNLTKLQYEYAYTNQLVEDVIKRFNLCLITPSNTAVENIIGAPKMQNNFWLFFQYLLPIQLSLFQLWDSKSCRS